MLCVALGDFLWQGPLRPTDRGDFIAPFTAASRFLHSTNPYQFKNFVEDWHAAGAPASLPLKPGMDVVAYPPSTLLVFSPFTLMPWRVATGVYTVLCTGLYFLLIYRLSLQVSRDWRDWRRLCFVAVSLALSPVQAGIHMANLSILAFLLTAFALLFAQSSNGMSADIAAGLLLTGGVFLKPTVGLTLFLLFLLTRRWRIVAICVALSSVLAAITFLKMSHMDPVWRTDYQNSLSMIISGNGPGSFSRNSLARFDLLNFQLPCYQIYGSVAVANVTAWAVSLALGLWWLVMMLRRADPRSLTDWAPVAAISLLSMLPLYQRNYNAGILIFALLWAFRHFEERLAKVVIALSCVPALPIEGFLRAKIYYRHLPVSVTNNYLWNAVVMPNAAWALFGLTCLMLWIMHTHLRITEATGVRIDAGRVSDRVLASRP